MQLLLSDRRLVIGIGSVIEYGVWGNFKDMPSWRINNRSFAMDDNYTVEDIGDIEIPTYVKPMNYYYIDGEFKLADDCPNEYKDRIVTLEADMVDTQDAICEQSVITETSIADIENALCETELLTDERIAALEDALCELSSLFEVLAVQANI